MTVCAGVYYLRLIVATNPWCSAGTKAFHQHKSRAPPLTGVAGALGLSPVPRCKPRREPDFPGEYGVPVPSFSAPSCQSTWACWYSHAAAKEDSGGPGATSHTQANSRTSKDARLRIGTCDIGLVC